MPSLTIEEFQRKKEEVKNLWANGVRSIYKIADTIGSHHYTVKKLLATIRRDAQKYKKEEQRLDYIRLEEDAGLLQDINQINTLIQEIKSAQDKKTEIIMEDDKLVKKRQQLLVTDYYAICHLMRCKLEARKQRAELWGLNQVNPMAVVNNFINNKVGGNGSFAGEDREFSSRIMGELRTKLEK